MICSLNSSYFQRKAVHTEATNKKAPTLLVLSLGLGASALCDRRDRIKEDVDPCTTFEHV